MEYKFFCFYWEVYVESGERDIFFFLGCGDIGGRGGGVCFFNVISYKKFDFFLLLCCNRMVEEFDGL